MDFNDWQFDFTKISQRGKYLLESGTWSDCKFYVGTDTHCKEFKAHKLILSMASPVFGAMLQGELFPKEDTKILDITPEAFSSMLEYIYSDDLNLKSFDHACEVCYAAKKYMLPDLVKKCTTYIWADINPENTCRAYEFAKLFDEPDLLNRCMKIIVTKTSDIMKSSYFPELSAATLNDILDQEVLNITEIELYKAVEKWIYQKLNIATEEDQDEESITKIRNFSKPYVSKIRFLTMTAEQFAKGPAQSRLLQKDDILAILMNISAGEASNLPMPENFSNSRNTRKKSRTSKSSKIIHSHSLILVKNNNIGIVRDEYSDYSDTDW